MSLIPLLFLAVTLVATNAQQQPDPKVIEMLEQRNWRKYTQEVGLVAFKWTTNITGQLVNETAWLSERNNVVAMKSRDRDVRKKGFERVDTMIDLKRLFRYVIPNFTLLMRTKVEEKYDLELTFAEFKTDDGEMAIRVRVPTSITALPASMVDPQMTRREKRQKLRDLVKGRDRMCFIHSDPRLTLAAVKTELQRRVAGSPVQMGVPQNFAVKEQNRILTQNLKSPLVTSFCTKAAEYNNNFRLEQGTPVASPTSKFKKVKFMGQINTAQAGMSVPYTLHIEQKVMDGVTSEPV